MVYFTLYFSLITKVIKKTKYRERERENSFVYQIETKLMFCQYRKKNEFLHP